MKNPKVILTGTYSSYNKGDAAMQISTGQAVRKLWPKAEVVINAPFPQYDEKVYKEFKVLKSTRRNLIYGTVQVVRARLYYILKRYFKIKSALLLNNDELRNFESANLVIDLSGDTLTEDYGPHVTYSHFLPILIARAFKKPVFVCAQSIGPFKLTTLLSRAVLNRVSMITVREAITQKYLQSIGVKKDKIKLTADMAFLLQPASTTRVQEIMKKERVDSKQPITIGVALSNLVEKRYDKSHQTSKDAFVVSMAQMLDRLVESQKASILFIGHVTGPSISKDDRIVAKKVLEKMHNKSHATVISGNYRPEELKGIISNCDVFLGSRMHSNIGALSTYVPTVAIGYSHKTKGIMESLDMKEYVFGIDTLDTEKLYQGVVKAAKQKAALSKKLEKGISKIRKKSEENVAIIKKLVEDNS